MRQILIPPRVLMFLLVSSTAIGILAPFAGPLAWPIRVLGGALIVPALLVSSSSAGHFREVGTNIYPFLDPDVLVVSGHFRWTRNPMYVGFLGILSGAALAIGSLSAWIGPLVYFLYSQLWIIPFEEERMNAQFGSDYESYRRRVPRWIGLVRS